MRYYYIKKKSVTFNLYAGLNWILRRVIYNQQDV